MRQPARWRGDASQGAESELEEASARSAAAAAAAASALRLEIAGAVRAPVDAHDRKDNHGRRLGLGVDIFAAAANPGLVRKADDFAHGIPLTRPDFGLRWPAR